MGLFRTIFAASVPGLFVCFATTTTAAVRPSVIDNSATKYFPPLAHQGEVASCDWFAVAYYQMTYMENRQRDRATDSTNIFSPKFGFTLVNCGSTWPTNLWFPDVYELLKRHGSPTIAELPYDLAAGQHYREWCTNADVWQEATAHRIQGGESLQFNLDRIRDVLAAGEVLVVQCFPYDCDFTAATNNPTSTNDDRFVGDEVLTAGRSNPDHTMCVVGYNDDLWADANGDGIMQSDELGAIRIADSAGGRGINNGYRWIAYRAMRDPAKCVIFENKFWRMLLRTNYQPRIVARITLNSAQRDKLKMQFGRCAQPESAAAMDSKRVFDPYAIGFKPGFSGRSLIVGGDCSFSGGEQAGDGSFAFDLSDLIEGGDAGGDYWFFRLKNEGEDPAQIKRFEIVDLVSGNRMKDAGLPVSFANGERFRFLHW